MSETGNSTPLAAIALGSNLGNPLATVKGAVEVLGHEATTMLVGQSHWYKTIAVGPAQPDYVNGCIVIETRRSPQDLLHLLVTVEREFGRQRAERWGPRTLDLDLLLYDSLVLETPELILPHPRMVERAFVLVPLAELLPNWIHPATGLTVRQHRDRVDCTGVALLPN
ncbi:2-amino-4-hydroxy-6-hydroxymethyldihydropteridine diphosphokinase [Altericista sp. CCNU0014]|uniref:2-amino-4-hydroxy-6- hydroxymethyldihydropteridine diphosphokinase n=1 Tax=Altericista sp. CCNU0014 TaxID=3082949 RepID=UPI00384C900A